MDQSSAPVPRPHIADYVVIVIFICICIGIGIYYGYQDKKNPTLENYFFGNRRLLYLPVAMSLFVTFFSAISLIGLPVEVYMFGIRIVTFILGYSLSLLLANFTIVPLLYPLKLMTTYEYLQLRFNSKGVRMIGTMIGMIQTFTYMGVTLYAPALALQVVAGIPIWMSIAVIGLVGTIYTTIGGIKSVIWTDAFQFVVIVIALFAVIIKGTSLMGTEHSIGEIARKGGRLEFFNFDLDPRVRHTNWGLGIGGVFSQIPSWCNQASVQRMSAVRNLRSARITILLMIPIVIASYGMLGYLGVLMYSYYNEMECDPVGGGFISNFNQLTPYFVFDVLRTLPGLYGLFISCIFSGALSTFSSGINALSANTVEDILGDFLKKSKLISQTLVAKSFAFLYGVAVIGVAYAISYMPGSIFQITTVLFGGCGGPLAGLYFLGGLVPNANSKGAIVGSITAIVCNGWIALGSMFKGKRPVRLTPNPITGCFVDNHTTIAMETSTYTYNTSRTILYDATDESSVALANSHDGFSLYDISYVWYGFIGFFLTLIIGTVVSLCTGGNPEEPVKEHLLFPVCRKIVRLTSQRGNDMDNRTLPMMETNTNDVHGKSLITYTVGEDPNTPML